MNKNRNNIILRIIINHLGRYPTPGNLTYAWSFGSLAGLCLVIQIITGLVLSMHYTPHIDLAFMSVEGHIMRDMNYGWFFRYTHSNGASMFFIVTYLHIGKNLMVKAYMYPRQWVWHTGLILFILLMVIAFTGYVLPWGQMSFWGATVITNFFTAIPYIGDDIAYWIWGGFSIDNPTLQRFYTIHFFLPFVMVGVVFIHLNLLHAVGSTDPLGAAFDFDDDIPFYPYYYTKDLVSLFIFFIIFVYLVFFEPNLLGHPDNYIEAVPLVTPLHIVPEWYFLPFYAMLRAIPNKLGGLLCMVLSILIFFILPYIDCPVNMSILSWSIFRFSYFVFIGNFWLLIWLGAQTVEYPFIEATIICTGIYFYIIIIVWPCLAAITVLLDNELIEEHYEKERRKEEEVAEKIDKLPWSKYKKEFFEDLKNKRKQKFDDYYF